MAQQLAALGPAQSDTEAKHNILLAVKETAKHLGNRPAACRKYYIHPVVFESYVEQTIFSAMQHVESGATVRVSGLRTFEVAVLRLVQSRTSKRKAKQPKAS